MKHLGDWQNSCEEGMGRLAEREVSFLKIETVSH